MRRPGCFASIMTPWVRPSAWPAAAVALALLASCQSADSTDRTRGGSTPGGAGVEETADPAVRAASAAWDDAHNAGDLDRLMQLYDEAAVSMPYNRPALEGRTAIEADFREFFATSTAQHHTTIVSLEVVDDLAVERGQYQLSVTPRDGSPTVTESGKHIVVRERVGGQWKIRWEIWNTDSPTGAP
jgi:uncharacterized protein (TIGR02246 family)